jgi:hypothetical protein
MKNAKTALYWIYAQHNNSLGLFFILYNAGAYCIGRRRWMFLRLIDRIWGHHRTSVKNLLTILQTVSMKNIISILFQGLNSGRMSNFFPLNLEVPCKVECLPGILHSGRILMMCVIWWKLDENPFTWMKKICNYDYTQSIKLDDESGWIWMNLSLPNYLKT